MSGGKETPRQKMIGMMYLVLLALLAMNVSKEIINAFVTLNDNIEGGNQLLSEGNDGILYTFDAKIATLQNTEGSPKEIERVRAIQQKAVGVRKMTQSLSNFYIKEAADMISKVEAHPEGGDWFQESEKMSPIGGQDGSKWLELKPLMDISAKDNYDVPTFEFVGGNLKSPKERGLTLVNRLHSYRDSLIMAVANYEKKGKEGEFWSYEPQEIQPPLPGQWGEVSEELKAAFANVNNADTSKLMSIYKMLTVPVNVVNHEEEYPWIAGQFDHAPLVAAVAVFTSLRSKMFQAESIALDMLARRVKVATFNFNKIEPLAFSGSSYVNQGDSLAMKVMIAAYDSTAPMKLQYWVNDSTKSEDGMQTYEGDAGKPLILPGDQTGEYTVFGNIEVEVKGSKEWKPWRYTYKVGKPGGAIALPEMSTLYKGYPNKVQASASGYPPDAINLSCSGCSLSKKGEGWIATVPTSARGDVTMSLSARTEEGGSVSLAQQKFKISDFPKPTVFIGGVSSGGKISRGQIARNPNVLLKLEGSPLVATFKVSSFAVIIGSRKVKCSGSRLSGEALNRIGSMQPGSSLSVVDVQYTGTGPMRAVGGGFEIR